LELQNNILEGNILKKIALISVILFMLLSLNGCTEKESEDPVYRPVINHSAPKTPLPDLSQALVVRTLKGNSLIVKINNSEQEFTLTGIDFPKIYTPYGLPESDDKGALDFIKPLEGTTVYLETDDSAKSGLNEGYIYTAKPGEISNQEVRDKMLNARLILMGYAKMPLNKDFKYADYFMKCETEARNNRAGVWDKGPIIEEEPYQVAAGEAISFPASSLSETDSNYITVGSIKFKDVETTGRDFEWQYNGSSYRWRVEVPQSLVDWDRKISDTCSKFYAGDSGSTQSQMLSSLNEDEMHLLAVCSTEDKGNFSVWAAEEQNNRLTAILGEKLLARAQADGFDDYQTANFVLGFICEALMYSETNMQLPAQTIVDNGNSDCKALLFASILNNMGYRTSLLVSGKNMAVGVAFQQAPKDKAFSYYEYKGVKYYFTQTTAPGLHVGEKSESSSWGNTVCYPINQEDLPTG